VWVGEEERGERPGCEDPRAVYSALMMCPVLRDTCEGGGDLQREEEGGLLEETYST
jgi:hypothetical protein